MLASQKSGRSVVRDPRKRIKQSTLPAALPQDPASGQLTPSHQEPSQRAPLPFMDNNAQQQQSLGSSMVSYAVAGVGMTLGFILVGAIIGL